MPDGMAGNHARWQTHGGTDGTVLDGTVLDGYKSIPVDIRLSTAGVIRRGASPVTLVATFRAVFLDTPPATRRPLIVQDSRLWPASVAAEAADHPIHMPIIQ